MDNETLAHTKWNCKYHIVFAPMKEYYQSDQLSLFEPVDPFTGKPESTGKKNPGKLL